MEISKIEKMAQERLEELRPLYDEYLTLSRMLAVRERSTARVTVESVGPLVVEVLSEHRGTPMGAGEVLAMLSERGHDLTMTQVANAMQHLARTNVVEKTSRGRYQYVTRILEER